jgi:hypothetical protein
MAVDRTMYLGLPGRLEQIELPRGNVEGTRVRQVDTYQLGNGGVRVGKLLGGSRRYTIAYRGLTYDTFKVLEAYDQGHRGAGPFVFLDPGRRNILTVNQSSTTSERNDTDNFTLAGTGAALTSESTLYRRGPRTLKWTFSAAAATATAITLDTPAPEWHGFPVQVGRDMCLSAYLRGGGTDGAVGVALALRWLTEAGATISTSTGSTVTTNSSTWQQASASGEPPATAAYVQPRISAVSGIATDDIVYLDELMLHEGTTPDATWSPGTGILPVVPITLSEAWSFQAPEYRTASGLVLQEVGG